MLFVGIKVSSIEASMVLVVEFEIFSNHFKEGDGKVVTLVVFGEHTAHGSSC